MDTFGVTTHGVPCELGFARAQGHCEPREQRPRQPNCASERWLDPELLRADGRPLASHWRWSLQRKAHVRDPCGPRDRFRYPVTTSMDIGWGLVDPALCGTHFLCNDLRSPLVQSDVFRLWHEQMLHTNGDELQLRTRKPVDLAELTPKVRCVPLPATGSGSGSASRGDKQPWMAMREAQILGGAMQPTFDVPEPQGAAGRLQQLEMKRLEEARAKHAQREGSRIMRAQMERMRDRKDLQPPPKYPPRPWEPPPEPEKPAAAAMASLAGAPCCGLQEPRSPLQPKELVRESEESAESSKHMMVHGTQKNLPMQLAGTLLHGYKPFVSTQAYGRAVMKENPGILEESPQETLESKKGQESMDVLKHAAGHAQDSTGAKRPSIALDYKQMRPSQIQRAHYDRARSKIPERYPEIGKTDRPKLHNIPESPPGRSGKQLSIGGQQGPTQGATKQRQMQTTTTATAKETRTARGKV